MSNKLGKQTKAEKKAQNRYKVNKRAEIVFVLSGGWPKCSECGKKLPSNLTNPDEESGVTVHHQIRLESLGMPRARGSKSRILEWAKNMWNLKILCPECHEKAHEGQKGSKMVNSPQNTIKFVQTD